MESKISEYKPFKQKVYETHENRTLLSKVLLRATTCLLLTSGIGISPAFAVADLANTVRTERMQQQKVSVSGVVKDKNGEPIIGASIMEKEPRTELSVI